MIQEPLLSCSSPGWLSVCRSPAAPLGAGPTQWDDVARPWHPSSPLPFFIRGRLSDSGTRLISCAEEILPSHKPGAGSIQLGVRAVVLMGNTHRVSAMHASGEHSTIGCLPLGSQSTWTAPCHSGSSCPLHRQTWEDKFLHRATGWEHR